MSQPFQVPNELCTDAVSPIHLFKRELRDKRFTFERWKRPLEEHRLKKLKIVGTVPVIFGSDCAATCFDIDIKESDFLLAGSFSGKLDVLNLRYMHQRPLNDKPAIPEKYHHKHTVYSVQWYGEDISMFATASLDGTVKVWDLSRQKPFHTFDIPTPRQMHWNEIDKNNPLIAVSDSSSNVILIDLRGNSFQNIRNKKAVDSVRWFPSDQILFVGSGNGVLSCYDIRNSRKSLREEQIFRNISIFTIKFAFNGQYLIIFGGNHHIYILDTISFEILFTREIDDLSGLPQIFSRNMCVIEEGNFLRVAIPISRGYFAWLTIDTQKWEEIDFVLHSTVGVCSALVYRKGYQQLIGATLHGVVASWSSEGERAKANLETENAYQGAREDTWSDNDD